MSLSSLIKLGRAIAVLVLFFAWQACGNPPLASILADKECGISATVVILPPEVVFMITQPVHLYDLAHAVKKHLPRIERLLNLDGGPSTGFKTETTEILNEWPVRNYLVKQ